jgi:hypothetical protein
MANDLATARGATGQRGIAPALAKRPVAIRAVGRSGQTAGGLASFFA